MLLSSFRINDIMRTIIPFCALAEFFHARLTFRKSVSQEYDHLRLTCWSFVRANNDDAVVVWPEVCCSRGCGGGDNERRRTRWIPILVDRKQTLYCRFESRKSPPEVFRDEKAAAAQWNGGDLVVFRCLFAISTMLFIRFIFQLAVVASTTMLPKYGIIAERFHYPSG